MKYQVGQKVKIKTKEELLNSGWYDERPNDSFDLCLWHSDCDECFAERMFDFCGQCVTIEEVFESEYFTIVEDDKPRFPMKYIWCELMISIDK